MTAPTYEKLTPPTQGTPVTVSAGGVWHIPDDPIVPEWASRSLDGRANVTRRVYEGLHHETHNEPSGASVIDDTIAWILKR